MTRKELIAKLHTLGMDAAAEKELKQLLQVIVAGRKATTSRRQRQQEYRWQILGKPCLGIGLYWLREARNRGWTDC